MPAKRRNAAVVVHSLRLPVVVSLVPALAVLTLAVVVAQAVTAVAVVPVVVLAVVGAAKVAAIQVVAVMVDMAVAASAAAVAEGDGRHDCSVGHRPAAAGAALPRGGLAGLW
jgi:hypothetical protein